MILISAMAYKPCVVIHGGCGVINRQSMTEESEQICRAALKEALFSAYELLIGGGSSGDAVVTAVSSLENCPMFNAGKGAVFSADGTNECDAGIAVSGTKKVAGAVSCVSQVKNPIVAAYQVLKATPHVQLCGSGADEFARSQGLEMVPTDYYRTETRYYQYCQWKLKNLGGYQLPPTLDHNLPTASIEAIGEPHEAPEHTVGTVGAVAIDWSGTLAGGSSTGGLTGRLRGRVSDSSVFGAGFYADDQIALSGTGNGDNFIRFVGCHEVASLVKYKQMRLVDAADAVMTTLGNGVGIPMAGFIGLDKAGNVAMPYNTPGMFRGVMRSYWDWEVLIWED